MAAGDDRERLARPRHGSDTDRRGHHSRAPGPVGATDTSRSDMAARDQPAREARARALIAGVWAGGTILICAIVLSLADGSPSGRAFAVLGGALLLGVLVALGLVAVNVSLARDARRTDAAGAADVLTLAAHLVSLAAVVVGALVTRPYGAVTLAVALVGVVELTILVVLALATRRPARVAARRPTPVEG